MLNYVRYYPFITQGTHDIIDGSKCQLLPERNRLLGRPRLVLENNIKMDLKETELDSSGLE